MNKSVLSYEQKRLILESNGWETLWSKNNWVKTEWLKDSKINDSAGCNTDEAFERVMLEMQCIKYYNEKCTEFSKETKWHELRESQQNQFIEYFKRIMINEN